MERDAETTPVHEPEFYSVLGAVCPTLSHEARCILMAHWALETGRGRKCMNYNIGNFKALPGRDWCYFTTWERIQGTKAHEMLEASTTDAPCEFVSQLPSLAVIIKFKPKHPAAKFCAYLTFEKGLKDYIRHLQARFPDVWTAMAQGDPVAFTDALWADRYFTGDLGVYTQSIRSLWHEYTATYAHTP